MQNKTPKCNTEKKNVQLKHGDAQWIDGNLVANISNPKNGNVTQVILAHNGEVDMHKVVERQKTICPKSGQAIEYQITWTPKISVI